ncbi:MAG: hypothetical protein ACK4KV_13440 [Rhodocyclaceae bacterium]
MHNTLRPLARLARLARLAGATASVLICFTAAAAGDPPPRPEGQPPAPPPEAVAACNGQSAGASVSFTGPNGEQLSGQCRQVGDTLAAMPAGGPPGGRKP